MWLKKHSLCILLDTYVHSCKWANTEIAYIANTLEEVLTTGNYAHVLSFLKEINLYKKV